MGITGDASAGGGVRFPRDLADFSQIHGGDWERITREQGLYPMPSLRLDFSVNLNPLGMPPAVEAQLEAGSPAWHRYPPPYAGPAAEALARAHGLSPDQVLLGNGSTELIALVLRVLKPARATWVEPSYCGYREACQASGLDGKPLAWAREEDDFRLRPEALSWDADLVFLGSPNNPTGAPLDPEAVRRAADAHPRTWFVLDESYLDFTGSGPSASGLGREMPANLLVVKSLTKFFALPGLRLGMLAATPLLADRLRRGLLPWSLNAAAMAVAPLLYADAGFLAESRLSVEAWREELSRGLAGLGLRVFPSAANFLYLQLPPAWPGHRLQGELAKRGLLIRAYGDTRAPDGFFCRIAVRRPEENAVLLETLAEVLQVATTSGVKAPRRAARALMVLGTMSNSGKSTVAAALCRLAARKGFRVAPFKAQNMSLNSHVTPEGGEIGRAQAVQARAAGIASHTDMNPVLLKPTAAGLMQVIVDGRPAGNHTAREYYARKSGFRLQAHEAYDRLSARFDLIILEGAGSPAEINLRDEDFVNASMAEYAGARCVLVADIDRGGVFASILGTLRLLPRRHRDLVAGIVINKFRGDVSLLAPGIAEIERLTGVSVLGVLPYLEDLDWEEEDSLGLEARGRSRATPSQALVDIAVVRLPYLSNYTDFHPLERMPGVSLRYVSKPEQVGNPDLLILPGSKNVRYDMEFLRRSGLARVLLAAADRRIPLFGICGGYQILGRTLRDPHGVEGERGETPGLGLLPVETTLEREKALSRVEARNLTLPFLPEDAACAGYEIHMGRTTPTGPGQALLQNVRKDGRECAEPSGFRSPDAVVFGCYLHGLFDTPGTPEALARWLAGRKGLDWTQAQTGAGTSGAVFDRLADALETHLDLRGFFAQEGPTSP